MLLYVGRFTEVKRVPLLIEAYERARPGFNRRAPLVIVGGFPGEWEGEHPRDAIERLGARDVYLAGWHDHDELPDILLAATDVVVLPSVREQFGQVLVEGMACGLPRDRRRRATARRTSSTTARRAGWSSPTTSSRSPTRSSRPSTGRTSAAAAARTPPRTSRSATPGRRWPRRSPTSTTTFGTATQRCCAQTRRKPR